MHLKWIAGRCSYRFAVQILSSGNRELSDGTGGVEKDGRESSYVRDSTKVSDSKTGEKESCRRFSRTIHFGHSTK